MQPIVLIHGYSSEGDHNTVEDIYGSLPGDLRAEFGDDAVVELDLARWISLSDGISIDDISLGMERALRSADFEHLIESGFHVVTHSTGSLVARNWVRLFSEKPSPIANMVHLAGANFGSGLAHIGRGQLARWARMLQGVHSGLRILDELEFGSWKTMELHRHFRVPGSDMYDDYEVQEFGLVGSQTLQVLRPLPIKYVKEDSSDNTVRTAASNLNFNYVRIEPDEHAFSITHEHLAELHEQRLDNERLDCVHYEIDSSGLAQSQRTVPFTVVYETAHFGGKLGIVDGSETRKRVLPLLYQALSTPRDEEAYAEVAAAFELNTERTLAAAGRLKRKLTEWDRQSQYEGHTQVVFRIRDQFGLDVEYTDINFQSRTRAAGTHQLERMIEDVHKNKCHPGTLVFYLRTQKFDDEYVTLLDDCKPIRIEITAHEPDSSDIRYVPLTIDIEREHIPEFLQPFRTTIVDVTMARLPSPNVFDLERAGAGG